jgi:extracellular elastinolytic metalloproteinase
MRKAVPSLLAILIGTFATAVFAANGQFRGYAPKIARSDHGLTPPSASPPAEIVRRYMKGAGNSLAVARAQKGRGVTHVQMTQSIGGRPVYGAYVKATVDAQGRLTSIIDDTVDVTGPVVRTTHKPSDALQAAFRHRFGGVVPELYRDPIVTPVVVPTTDGLEHGFLVETWEKQSNLLWHTVVGAAGNIAHQELRTASDSYYIFPIHPGSTSQTLVNGPGTGNTESPIGWVTNDTTIGNNVDAYLDRDNNNTADTNGRPVSATQDFIYPRNSQNPPTSCENQELSVANLFYQNNVIHDKLYSHGFDEAAGNFQVNNFGNGGAGNDRVRAEAQDGGGTNNANFATPADGSSPRMQMYLWNNASAPIGAARDSALDADVIYHEYGHGLTWRMIGSMFAGLAGSIGEGMSDTVAIFMTANDRIGEYVKNNTAGIRRYPYTNYPLTYGSANSTSVHANGEIYAGTMWKLRGLWLGAGHTMNELWDYVIDGMNYTPANPEYEEMRDGILAAVPTTAKDCIVWDAFASMGIGVYATGTDSCNAWGDCTINISENFSKPTACQ